MHQFRATFWLGTSFVFASAVAFAGYLLLTPPLIQKFGSWNFTGLALTVACIGTLTHYTFKYPSPVSTPITTSSSVIWYGIGLGFLVTVLPTVMLMQSIERSRSISICNDCFDRTSFNDFACRCFFK